MKKYLQLIRMKQYIKNGLIFIAAFFAGTLSEKNTLIHLMLGFVSFCAVSSAVYILNDIRDAEKDRLHPVKCKRPIAAGTVKKKNAGCLAVLLFISGYILLSYIQKAWIGEAHCYILCYFLLNVGYSLGLKNVPILDIMILASGFLIRVLYGAALCDTWVSDWLYLTVLMISMYMGTGKRRNEKIKENSDSTRKVLRFYSISYMDKIMHMSMILAITFYSLWSASIMDKNPAAFFMIWTVPLVLAIVMRYEMLVENDNYGDPMEIIFADRPLRILTIIYGLVGAAILYGNNSVFSIIFISK